MQYLVDTHAHLCDPCFDKDRLEVIRRAEKAGVCAIICVGETINDAKRNLELACQYPQLLPAAGLYPAHVDYNRAEAMYELIKKERARLTAIGEVGLDYRLVTDREQRAKSLDIFAGFIDLSLSLDLPLNVHSRSAGRHAVDLLLKKGARRVQLHAFDGKPGAALPAAEAGFFFSIPPSVVRSRQKQKLLERLPISCLLPETDSPVLGPDRNGRNEPANISIVVDAISKVKKLSRKEVINVLIENTSRLYGNRIFNKKT